MKKVIAAFFVFLVYGCQDVAVDNCNLQENTYRCDPESYMKVIVSIDNHTDKGVFLGQPFVGDKTLLPNHEGSVAHGEVEIKHLERTYDFVPGNSIYTYYGSDLKSNIPEQTFTASVLFTEDLFNCMSEDAYQETPYAKQPYYNLDAESTLICSEEMLISLLIDYFVVTEENYASLLNQESGRPFTLSYSDEIVPFGDKEGSYRQITFHYTVLQSQ